MPQRPLRKEDLLTLTFAGDPQLSPDGQHIALTAKTIDAEVNLYLSHLWLYDVESGDLRPFTFGEVSDTSPRWSPDGDRLAFLRTVDSRTQIWTIPVDGGEARQLTDLPEGGISQLAWSPDGGRLAFAFRPLPDERTQKARKEREESGASTPPRVVTRMLYRLDGAGFLDERQHIWVCDAEAGEAQQITHGDCDDNAPTWDPTGDRVAFLSNRSERPERTPYEVDVWLVDADGGTPERVATPVGPKEGLSWSPDGSLLAYTGTEAGDDPWRPQHDRLWVVSPKGGDARCLTEDLDRPIGNTTLSDTRDAFTGGSPPLWNDDSSRLFVPVSRHGDCHIYDVPLDGEPHQLTDGQLDVGALSADREGSMLALLVSRPTRPGEIVLGTKTHDGLEMTPITDFNGDWLNDIQLCEPEELWVEADDGQRVQGWLLTPPDFDESERYPLLLYIHGGPHAQYGHSFFHELQWHAARGYAVLYANPRGSSGYSEEFMAEIRGNWGHRDHDDIMAALDHVVARPYIDESRLAVAGGSYGGYMTNWIVGHSDRFRCAITDRSVVNLQSMAGTSDIPHTLLQPDGYWAGTPWADPTTLQEQSPLRYLKDVETPTLIVHSEGDLRCPIEQAEQLFTTLKWLGVETVFVRYPSESSHGMSRSGPPDLRLDRLERIGNWLDRFLSKSS